MSNGLIGQLLSRTIPNLVFIASEIGPPSANSNGFKKSRGSAYVEGFKMIIITGHPFIDSFIVGMVSVILFAIYPFYVDATERYYLNPGFENLIFISNFIDIKI